ncbi:MAG TPA: hypothetical protein VLL08_33345 [Kineosporiaceae bacterium]|nr:hypothetical protein [Kineosporiaceae bacterium]
MSGQEWWQQILRERLPPEADLRFGTDGGVVTARFGPWVIDSGRACSWTDIRGPGIHDRLAITGPFAWRWNKVIAVLDALGAPIRPGRSFDPFGDQEGQTA